MKNTLGLLFLVCSAFTGSLQAAAPPHWWESTAAIVRLSLKPERESESVSLKPEEARAILDRFAAKGVKAIEIFAPAYGGNSFHGLDTIDRYRIDPRAGTMEDFRRFIKLAHDRGFAVTGFDNLGYSAVDAMDFLKACDDVKAGRRSREASFFLWSQSPDAPPPIRASGDTYFMVRPAHLPGSKPGTFYDPTKAEVWAYSDKAGQYYWSKWRGTDLNGHDVRLPQYDWSSPAFQEEARKIERFWMQTGLDGMVIDAVNWYVGYTWQVGRRNIIDVLAGFGDVYRQPEGAGGFHEDPVPWITEGKWNSVQDYGLGIWWEKGSNVIERAIESGDPRPIERALRDYHDRVIEAGGSLYFQPAPSTDPVKKQFALSLLATLGDLIQLSGREAEGLTAQEQWFLRAKAQHAALHQLSRRRALPVKSPERHYAFLRWAERGDERVLVVANFRPAPEEVIVDLSGVDAEDLTDLKTGEKVKRQPHVTFPLAGYGIRLFTIAPSL